MYLCGENKKEACARVGLERCDPRETRQAVSKKIIFINRKSGGYIEAVLGILCMLSPKRIAMAAAFLGSISQSFVVSTIGQARMASVWRVLLEMPRMPRMPRMEAIDKKKRGATNQCAISLK